MTSPSLSVIIIAWNHGHLLPDCLDALLAQECEAAMEVTVVDNGSHDDTARWLPQRYPEVRMWRFPDNRGFCRAFNWGVNHSAGELILSLNPDVVVGRGFVREMVTALGSHVGEVTVGAVAPKLVQASGPSRLDSTGLFVDRRRRPYDRGQGERDQGQYDALPYVFGACGAAALYRRAMLQDLAPGGEYLDEGFFAYIEDADLAWQAQLRGWRAAYAPRAVATHARGWGDTLRKRGRAPKSAAGARLALRNRYLMTIKNDSPQHLLADLLPILTAEMPRLAYAAVMRPGILLGLVDLAKCLPTAMRKRREIQSRRTVGADSIRAWFVNPEEAARRGDS